MNQLPTPDLRNRNSLVVKSLNSVNRSVDKSLDIGKKKERGNFLSTVGHS